MDTIIEATMGSLLLLVAWMLGFGAGREDHAVSWIGLLIIIGAIVFSVVLFVGTLLGWVEPLI